MTAGPTNSFLSFAKEEIERSLPDRFQQQVCKYPERVAVKGRKHTYTYDALNRSANRVARAILDLERERDGPIGIILEKDGPMMAALLGVLKIGRIYVPLEPTEPETRAFKILQDADASLIITDDKHVDAARELSGEKRKLVNIDRISSTLPEENIPVSIPADAPAYIIYTSGSTGEPKGVVQSHRNVLHNIRRHTNSLHISVEDRLTLLASCSTGQAVTDIYCALLNGATLCPFGIKEEGWTRLASWLKDEEISIYHSSASIFRYFFSSFDDGGSYPKIRLIKIGSEQVFKSDVELYKKRFSPHAILVNALSCSEAGLLRQIFIDKETSINSGVLPVGFPVEDMEILLLDDSGQMVELNTPGQIVIKSRYLSPGYWHRSDLTEEAFLPDPLEGGARLYQTGDMGRMARDGCLEYLGRKDHQVKIRGYRVEIAEVEAALLTLGRFRQVAVAVAEDRRCGKSLAAFVVPAETPAPSVASLRACARQKLPEHMVPAHFIVMEELPLTSSGKLDRRSLCAAKALESERTSTYVCPQSPLQSHIVHVWEELLGIRPIGIRDDFFDLGGHSLLAVSMIDQIEKICGTKLPLTVLLAGATVEHLARTIVSANREKFQSSLIAVQPKGSAPPFFFLHGDFNGGGFYCRDLARYLGDDQPFYAILPHGLDEQRIPHSIEEMAADRLCTLLEFYPHGPYLLGGHCNGGLVAFEMARQIEAQGSKVNLLVVIDASALNVQFRWLRSVVSLAALVLRLDRDRQVDWFKRLRIVSIRAHELSKEGRRAQVFSIVREMMNIVASAFGPKRKQARIESNSAPIAISQDKWWEYHSVIEGYVPRRYRGRVTFFRSNAMQSRAPADPSAGWKDVAREVEVHWLPGEHHSCLTEHAETLAEHLADCLRAASAEAGAHPAAQLAQKGNR